MFFAASFARGLGRVSILISVAADALLSLDIQKGMGDSPLISTQEPT